MALRLIVGNKNYSSWSMRAGVLMRALDIPFDETQVWFDDFGADAPFRRTVAQHSPAGRVPVLLLEDGFAVWDSLAIAETLHDLFPGIGVWPAAMPARARARSLCAEMHAGFGTLRNLCPMNIEADLSDIGARLWREHPALRTDVERIDAMWTEALLDSGGPMLFGRFGAVDAFYTPVVMRLRGYGLPVSDAARAYGERIIATPAVQRWMREALAEHRFVAVDEPYRTASSPAP